MDELKVAIPQELRSAAENTISKAKEAVDNFMKEAGRAYEKADASVQAAQSGMRSMNQKAIGYAEANINAAFDFAQKLVKAKDPQELLSLQQEYLKQQAEQIGTQMRELGAGYVEATKPFQSR